MELLEEVNLPHDGINEVNPGEAGFNGVNPWRSWGNPGEAGFNGVNPGEALKPVVEQTHPHVVSLL